mgnify:CR=1 FL=1
MELNAELETALNVELVIAANLREEIYAELAAISKMTAPPASVIETNSGVDDVDDYSNQTGKDNHGGAVHFDEPAEDNDTLDNASADVVAPEQINCFPNSGSESASYNGTAPVSVSKLTYLNHAELLRKFGGI